MDIKMIVAMDDAGGIGKDGKIPWYIKEDLQYFKNYTKNMICLMGRKTFEDIKSHIKHTSGEFLRERKCIVLTSQAKKMFEETKFDKKSLIFVNDSINNVVYKSLKSIKDKNIQYEEEHYAIIGGKTVYDKYFDICDEISITHINGIFDCDVKLDQSKILKNFEIVDSKPLTDESTIKIYRRKE